MFIIDEASDDGSLAIAEQLRREEPDRIHVIAHDTPQGLQKSANEILDLAQGRYIVRLDADDWFEESALLLMVAKLESDPELGLVFGNYYYTDSEGRVIGAERRRKLGLEDNSVLLPPHGACTMVRTRALKSVGGYSEDIDAQDGWELWYKLVHRVKAANIEAPLFYYRQHEQSLSRNEDRLLGARAKIIQKTSERLHGSYKPSCLAVVTVRESYPGFDGVPYRELGGRTLLEIALSSALGADGITEAMVSSASDGVLAHAQSLVEQGKVAEHIRVKRPPELSGSHIQLRDTLMHAAESYREARGAYPDIVAFLNLHAPLRRAEHVDKALNTLRINHCDSVVSVCQEREPIFTHGPDGLELLNPGRFEELEYERERLYRFNGAVLAVWWEVLSGGDVFGTRVAYIEMSKEDSAQIKHADDLQNPRIVARLTSP